MEEINLKKITFTPEQKEFITYAIDQWCIMWRSKIIASASNDERHRLLEASKHLKELLLTEAV